MSKSIGDILVFDMRDDSLFKSIENHYSSQQFFLGAIFVQNIKAKSDFCVHIEMLYP